MENKETKRWHAQKGERYFFINQEMSVASWVEDNYDVDDILFEHGNYFRTRKEALKVLEENKKTLMRHHGELRDFEWALQKMKEGLRVTCKSLPHKIPNYHIIIKNNSIYRYYIGSNGFYNEAKYITLDINVILANDWELYV